MNPVEDLLTRTLRDPARGLPVPADPLPAIRHRARAQRRNSVLGLAAVVLVVAATLLTPAAIGRTRPAPVATEPSPAGSGLLDWPASGPLAGDTELVRDAAERWPGSTGTVRLLWAGRVGTARVVLLQAAGPGGLPTVAEVGDRSGALTLLGTEPIGDPGVALLRLLDPAAGTSGRTLLLPRPGGRTVTLLTATATVVPVPGGGVATVAGVRDGQQVAVLDRDGLILGSGVLPPTGRLLLDPGFVRLVTPTWDRGQGNRPPQATDLTDGQVLGALVDPGQTEQIAVGVIDGGTTVNLGSGRLAEPRLYEVHRAGRTYLGGIVWIDSRPYCTRLDDVTDSGGQPDALVLRCPLPRDGGGIVWVELHDGIRMTGLRIEAAGPGQKALAPAFPLPADTGLVTVLTTGFPTGPGLVRLTDVGGLARPDIRLPPYEP